MEGSHINEGIKVQRIKNKKQGQSRGLRPQKFSTGFLSCGEEWVQELFNSLFWFMAVCLLNLVIMKIIIISGSTSYIESYSQKSKG